MNRGPCRYTSRRQKLEKNRRKIAAISFLSNIQVEGETDLPGYRCLEGTEVLKTYQENSYRRKLFRKKGNFNIELSPEVTKRSNIKMTPLGSCLTVEREKKSSVPQMYKQSYKPSQSPGEKPTRRRLNYMSQWSEDGVIEAKTFREKKGNSTESLLQQSLPLYDIVASVHNKVRKLSETLSNNSQSSSIKEVKFLNADDKRTLGEERLVLVTPRYVPFAVYSTIPYQKPHRTTRTEHKHELGRRLRHSSGGRPLPAINDSFDPFEMLGLERSEMGQEISYGCLLEPAYSLEVQPPMDTILLETGRSSPRQTVKSGRISPKSGRTSPALPEEGGWGVPNGTPYSPHTLDGWLGAGQHRTFLPFSSYMTSVIEYVKPADMKKELNEKFKEKFPSVNLTLTKLRSLKTEIRRIGIECDVDTVTIAQAYVYFEKLVLRNIINKSNRKFCAGACIILAAKLNDFKGEHLKLLIEKTETIFRLNRRDLLASEFAILVALGFSLHVPSQEVYPHYQRLIYLT